MIKIENANILAKEIQKFLSPHIPENTEFNITYFKNTTMGIGGGIECKSDWKLAQNLSEIVSNSNELENSIKKFTTLCPMFKGINLIFSKTGEPIASIYETVDYISDIKLKLQEEIEDIGYEHIIVKVSYEKNNDTNNDISYEIEETTVMNGETDVDDYSSISTELEFLYYSLDKRPKKIKITVDSNSIKFESDISIPELEIHSLSDNNEQEKDNDRILRYILSDQIGDDYISYSYMNDKDTRRFVDLTGNLIKQYLDIKEYKCQAQSTNNEKEIIKLFDKYCKHIRESILKELQSTEDAQYKNAFLKLINMDLKKVLFEKTHFESANKSSVFQEYMFFLGMLSKDSFTMDVHQSDPPELTDVFWMLRTVPKINWSDVNPTYPKSSLKFKR